ncbi:MAG: hypothetical protein DME34_00690 [Verrucomicrobia bacterium]|nr:MAG: hypothetical protein DME34_00690 [Verrucomicrobiota bacterium]
MRKKRISFSGAGAVVALLAIGVAIVVVLIIVDVTRKPPAAPPDTCSLVHHIILPDNCVCSNPKGVCFPTQTRPYLIFWTQAAAYNTLGCAIDLRNQ